MIPIVRRLLAWAVALALLLPLVLVLVLALGGLLTGLGDQVGGRICLRMALSIGLVWATAVVTTAVAGGLMALESTPCEPPGRAADAGPSQDRPSRGDEAAGR